MEQGMNRDRIATWRWIASILIYPVTILPGLNATVLLTSSVCVGLDTWSLEAALRQPVAGFSRGGRNCRALDLNTRAHSLAGSQPLAVLARHDGTDAGPAHGMPVLESGLPEPSHKSAQIRRSRALGLRRSFAGWVREPGTAHLGQTPFVQEGCSGPGPGCPASSSLWGTRLAAGAPRALPAASACTLVGTARAIRQPDERRLIVPVQIIRCHISVASDARSRGGCRFARPLRRGCLGCGAVASGAMAAQPGRGSGRGGYSRP